MAACPNPAKPFVFLIVLMVLSQICNARDIRENFGYVLYSGQTMFKYDTLTYGNYTLQFSTDCTLVLSDTGKQIWASSNRPIDQSCRCILAKNGNLMIYSGVIFHDGLEGVELWNAIKNSPYPAGHYVLILQKDQNLVIYGPVLWQTGTSIYRDDQMPPTNSKNERYVLYDEETINPGESLKNGRFSLVMQKDCNLVLYDGETLLWSTKTAGKNNNCIFKLQSDGNLVIYKTWQNRPIWAAFNRPHRNGHYVLVLQSDGNLVLYGKPIWSSGTHIVKAMPALNEST